MKEEIYWIKSGPSQGQFVDAVVSDRSKTIVLLRGVLVDVVLSDIQPVKTKDIEDALRSFTQGISIVHLPEWFPAFLRTWSFKILREFRE